MVKRSVLQFAFALLSLLLGSAAAQTVYDIPDGTGIEYIFYGNYTNTWLSDYPLTLGGVAYQVSVTMHFTEGNPAATYGGITFTHYTPTGMTSVTEALENINYNPFTYSSATATASFSGQFTGSLTFNIQQICGRRYCHQVLTTVNGVHSNFTID